MHLFKHEFYGETVHLRAFGCACTSGVEGNTFLWWQIHYFMWLSEQ